MSPREDARTKGARYLAEHRLLVVEVTEERIRARCRGEGEVYGLGLDAGGWHCSCPARGRCAHLHALMAVCVATREERGRG